jgi:dynein light intermediate chain 2
LFFVGGRDSGKSTIISRFLDKDEKPNPTIALEYTFGRKNKGQNGVKDVTHIYELGGGTFLADLIKIPINESNIHQSAYVIVIDLSKVFYI